MNIWMHKLTGKLMISFQVYAMCSETINGVTLEGPVYIGDACENENGIVCIFKNTIYDQFEFIGKL